MIKAEINSKAWLAAMYKVSATTLKKYIDYVWENHEKLSQQRQDKRYLSWGSYKKHCHKLTPDQVTTLFDHHGEPPGLNKPQIVNHK